MLLIKTGDSFQQKPLIYKFHIDPDLQISTEDPLRFWMLSNHVSNPTLKASGGAWRGNWEMSDVLYQIVVEMCTLLGQIVVDISASNGASAWACRASSRHFFGFESDQEIFDVLLKPICDSSDDAPLDDEGDEDLRASKDVWTCD